MSTALSFSCREVNNTTYLTVETQMSGFIFDWSLHKLNYLIYTLFQFVYNLHIYMYVFRFSFWQWLLFVTWHVLLTPLGWVLQYIVISQYLDYCHNIMFYYCVTMFYVLLLSYYYIDYYDITIFLWLLIYCEIDLYYVWQIFFLAWKMVVEALVSLTIQYKCIGIVWLYIVNC